MRWLRPASALLALCGMLCISPPHSSGASQTSSAKKKKKKRIIPKAPPVSPAVRAKASEEVSGMIDRTAGIPIENPAAMVPFFEQLLRSSKGEGGGPLRILHFGDSHTAADEWTGSLRVLLQAQ